MNTSPAQTQEKEKTLLYIDNTTSADVILNCPKKINALGEEMIEELLKITSGLTTQSSIDFGSFKPFEFTPYTYELRLIHIWSDTCDELLEFLLRKEIQVVALSVFEKYFHCLPNVKKSPIKQFLNFRIKRNELFLFYHCVSQYSLMRIYIAVLNHSRLFSLGR